MRKSSFAIYVQYFLLAYDEKYVFYVVKMSKWCYLYTSTHAVTKIISHCHG